MNLEIFFKKNMKLFLFVYYQKNYFLRFEVIALEFLVFRKNGFWKSY